MSRPRDVVRTLTVTVTAIAFIGILAGLALALGRGDGGPPPRALIGSPAPALAGSTLGGGHYRLRPSSGHVTIVNIWAAWCPPCRQELPLVARAAVDLRRQGVRVVTIDTRDGPVAARSLLSDVGAEQLLAVQDKQGRLAISWGATGVPETVVVDGLGVVRARWVGAVSRSWLDAEVRRWS